MKKLNKKYLILGISLLLCLTIGTTFAFSKIGSNTLLNNFFVGSLESEIKEDVPEVNGDTITKKPKVENISSTNGLLRVRITVSPEELWIPNNNDCILDININSNIWKYDDTDGYYYYQNILKPGEGNAAEVFSEVKLNNNEKYASIKDLLEDEGKFNIAIYQETIATKATAEDGTEISAIVDGEFDSKNADQIWNIYEKLNK